MYNDSNVIVARLEKYFVKSFKTTLIVVKIKGKKIKSRFITKAMI